MNAVAPAQQFFVWQAPGKPVEAHLNLGMVDRLGFAVSEGVQALPRRGLEIGGLLLGHAHRSESGIVVEIEDFELIDCEHAVGPSYLLTAKDRELMEARIRQRKSGGKLEVVGAFRSHTRKEFSVTPEDLDLLSGYFAGATDVFLLIHALRDAPLTAGFAIREGGEIRSITPYAPFPFRGLTLESGAYRLLSAEAPATAPVAREAPPAPALREPLKPAAEAPRVPVVQAPPQAIVLVIQLPHLPSMEQLRSALQSKWLTAFSALAVLALAAAWFRPSTPAQSTPAQVISASMPAPLPAPSEVAAAERPRPFITPPVQEPSHLQYRDRGVTSGDAVAAPRVMSSLPPGGIRPPDRPAAALPEPPIAAPLLASNFKAPTVLGETVAPASPPAVDPFVNVTVESEAPDLGDFANAPARMRSRPDFVGPTPLRQFAAEVPAVLRERMKHEMSIDVRVYINAAGKVEFAEPTSGASGVKKDLGAIAVFTSRRWIFAPATSGMQNVPSEVVLRYRFGAGLR